jgi:transposase-like protein
MAKINVKCPDCGEIMVVKYGKSRRGEQRYYCRNEECKTTIFQLKYKNHGCERGVEHQIIEMAVNASGIRDTARVLKISTYKVMKTLKKRNL